ncbi:MAG: SRPBCC domain-containing protein [Bacteroidetes bacterium]|nr:SRPBCC domain-containing protein [Bacteroidota bacterium]
MILYPILGLVALIGILSFTGFEINKKIEINAPAETVWTTILDFDSYSEWNSQLEYINGDIKPNGWLHLKLSVQGTDPYEFRATISSWEEIKRFAWLARTSLPGIFDGEHFFELETIDQNTTLLTNREEYRGVLSLIIKNLPMMKNAPAGFEKMNSELKSYIENEK